MLLFVLFKLGQPSDWFNEILLPVILYTLGSILLTRAIHYVAVESENWILRTAAEQIKSDLIRSEQTKYVQAIVQILDWTLRTAIYVGAFIIVVEHVFAINLGTFVVPATVLGVALGFGAQRIVQDVLAGFFIITERQYGVGDVIRISPPGTIIGISGTVEEVTLRITRIRTLAGELVVIPNGQILQVANLSRDWSQVVIDVQIPLSKAPERAREILEGVCGAFLLDERFAPMLLSRPEVTGVESISLGFVQMRVLAKTLPSRQWEVGRELRERVVEELLKEGFLSDASQASIVQQVV